MGGAISIATLWMATILVVVCALVVSSWWLIRSLRAELAKQHIQQIYQVAEQIAHEAEVSLVARDIPRLQQIIAQVGKKHAFEQCSVVMPKGQIVADVQSERITHHRVPQRWTHDTALAKSEVREAGYITLRYPIHAVGRGSAVLELTASLDHVPESLGQSLFLVWVSLAVLGSGS